jgi:RuvB-like protein 1 (pontin 52)
MIVKTESYVTEQIAKVLQLRANVEGLKMGAGVLEKLAAEGEKSSLRYVRALYGQLNAG